MSVEEGWWKRLRNLAKSVIIPLLDVFVVLVSSDIGKEGEEDVRTKTDLRN